jgi:diguanylate cyclase (GGDEF)-like protein
MATQQLSSEALRAAAAELDRCLYNHEQWLDSLFGALICHLQPDERDLDRDAYRRCRLGQWYYSPSGTATALIDQPGFAELGHEHERMHRCAADMLRASEAGEIVPLDSYQRFINSLKRMRMEIFTLKRDIEDALYSLDSLTGIPGRIGLLGKLREQRSLVQRGVQSCCLAIMDLDKFKSVNDEHGHAAGDKVLVAFAHHLADNLRPYDKVFRYGGEEFLIVLPDTRPEEGFDIVERLREQIAALSLDVGTGEQITITASFGIVLLDPDISVEKSIERADRALYAAKADGRNRGVVWATTMTDTPPCLGGNAAA